MSAHNYSPYNVEHPCNHENPPYYLTAYGLAVKLGFKGTEEEWLAALKGKPFTFDDFSEEQLVGVIDKVAKKLKSEGVGSVPVAKVVALSAKDEETTGGVGFGTCIVMHDKKSCLVFDFGNDKGVTLKKYLSENGIKVIDAIFISHFHSDHYQLATLQDLLRSYSVKSVVLPHTGIDWDNGYIAEDVDYQWYRTCYEETLRAAEIAGAACCKPAEPAEGETREVYTYGDFKVTCHNVGGYTGAYYQWNYSELLYSKDENGEEKPPNYNNFSMVNTVTFAGHQIIVTGDIMEPAVANTLDVLSVADLIFVPHHGLDIRIPPAAFNRLTARHAVINAAYDADSYLLSVSRAFAGELINKGCRVTTTHNGAMAGYVVGEEIAPIEPGVLAGNEIYPCGLLPEEDLDMLPDGEYITYSEAIADTIKNKPPFTVKPVRKFKVKVESTYISDAGNRTQTAYTIDTSTRPETARRNFSGGKYHDWVIASAEGQFHSVIKSPSAGHLDNMLINQIADMPAQSYRNIILSFTEMINLGGENGPQVGGHWSTEIFKQSENYAIITAKSYIFYGTALQRVWFKDGEDDDPNATGILHPWEWVNPPMVEGVEYRTTERINGKAIYRKLSGGKEYYRVGDSGDWVLKTDSTNSNGVTCEQIGAATKDEICTLPFNIIEGRYINSTGNEATSASFCATDYIIIAHSVEISTRVGDDASRHAFYDKDKNFISAGTVGANGGALTSLDVPENARYIRVSCWAYYKDELVVKSGSAYDRLTSHHYAIAALDDRVGRFEVKAWGTGKTVVNIGDSIFGQYDTNSISSYLENFSNATVYNCGFGGTKAVTRSETAVLAPFDFPNIATAICTGDWSAQEYNKDLDDIPVNYKTRLEIIESVDFSSVDVLTIAYGTNDWAWGYYLDGGIPDTLTEVISALETGIKKINKTYPHIKIVLICPIWRWLDGSDSDTTTYGTGTLEDFSVEYEKLAKKLKIPYLDAYHNLTFNNDNRIVFYDEVEESSTHLNAEGRKMYAELLNGKLKTLF